MVEDKVKDGDMTLQEVVYRRSITLEKCEQELLKPLSDRGRRERERGSSTFLYFSAFIANLIAFACGISFAWTSPVIPKLNGRIDPDLNPLGQPITSTEESWIAGLLSLGAVVGPFAAGRTADKIGRKKTLLAFALPILVSYIMTAFGQTVLIFYIARLVLGVGVGSIFAVLPMYLGEIAEDHNRGLLGCLLGVFLSSGLLYTFVIGPYLTVKCFSLACTIPVLIFLPIFLICIPESPHYLGAIGDVEGLRRSLRKLRGRSNVEDEVTEMTEIQGEKGEAGGIRKMLSGRATRKAFIIGLGLILLMQFAGINAVLSYMHSIFDATGSDIPPAIATIIIGTVQLITTIVTSSIVERLGRKILLLLSCAGCFLSLLSLGAYFYVKRRGDDVDSIYWLPIVSLIVYIIAFNVALGPLPWALMGELFPQEVKSIATTIITAFCFLASFLITLFFPVLAQIIGMAQSFWAFSVFCFVGTIFIQVFVPETKGKTLQEIQIILGGK